MSDIQVLTQTVYRAPTKGRRYLTARAAAIAEAGAMLELKYPSERPEWDVGDPGWHWRSDEAHLRTHRRLSRMILRRLRVATPKDADPRELLETALNRIEDMLAGDDGQAFKEARKFLDANRPLSVTPSAPTAVEPVQRDTERMNWLEQVGTATIQRMRRLDPKAPKYWDIEFGNDENTASGQSLRAAIDAARASKGTP